MGQQRKFYKTYKGQKTTHFIDGSLIDNLLSMSSKDIQYEIVAEEDMPTKAGTIVPTVSVPLRDQLESKEINELKALCKDRGIKIPPSLKDKGKIIQKILEIKL